MIFVVLAIEQLWNRYTIKSDLAFSLSIYGTYTDLLVHVTSFGDELATLFEEQASDTGQLLLLGDFNIHMDTTINPSTSVFWIHLTASMCAIKWIFLHTVQVPVQVTQLI